MGTSTNEPDHSCYGPRIGNHARQTLTVPSPQRKSCFERPALDALAVESYSCAFCFWLLHTFLRCFACTKGSRFERATQFTRQTPRPSCTPSNVPNFQSSSPSSLHRDAPIRAVASSIICTFQWCRREQQSVSVEPVVAEIVSQFCYFIL